jgi:hypothetical protein
MLRAVGRRISIPVIARSAATKQSILSLRGVMDCFASLAMTVSITSSRTGSRRTAPFASRAASASIAAGRDLAAEFGGGVPAPARVVEHAARQRDHVGLAGGDDVLGLLRLR